MLQRRCAQRTGARFASTASSRRQPESRENSVLEERSGSRRAPVVGCRRPGCATEIRLNFVPGA
jgi:hypothetical protein